MPSYLRVLLYLFVIPLLVSAALSTYSKPDWFDFGYLIFLAMVVGCIVKFAQRAPWSWRALRWIAIFSITFDAISLSMLIEEFSPSIFACAVAISELGVSCALLWSVTRSVEVRLWFFGPATAAVSANS